MKRKVALIGVYPPPVGGISVHIQRLAAYLDQQAIPYTLYDNTWGEKAKPVIYTGSVERWSLFYFFRAKESVIHCHFLRWQVRFFLSLLKLRGKRIVFSVHSYRPAESDPSLMKRWMIRWTGRLADQFICVSQRVANDIVEAGIPRDKVVVIPPFIPPVEEKNPRVPKRVKAWLGRSEPLLVANGALGVFERGRDLYGADLCIELMRRLVNDVSGVRLLFCVTHVVDETYRETLFQRVREYGLEDRLLFNEAPLDLYPVLQRADVFLRPTVSDGDAISVREALWYGVPVVASDAVERPASTTLFPDGDSAAFARETKEILAGRKGRGGSQKNYAKDIVALYGLNAASPE